jgi:predicted amidophosphoribosyltransferase
LSLTVVEAAATYERSMRNVAPAAAGVCTTCHTFIDPHAPWDTCYACGHQPSYLDVAVPITYSEHLGQMHTALRNYKDGVEQAQRYAMPRLASILWLFLEQHERCVAVAAGARSAHFDTVVTVPSSTPQRDDARGNLRWIVGVGCQPTASRFERVLRASNDPVLGREFHPGRYVALGSVDGADVLLIDDTWTTGGHAQSAACELKAAGARTVALVVLGRHIRRDWEPQPGVTNGEKLDGLKPFDWTACCEHVT